MKVKIEITTDNAAFEPDMTGEVIRILTVLISKLEQDEGGISMDEIINLRDINGNFVGKFYVEGY